MPDQQLHPLSNRCLFRDASPPPTCPVPSCPSLPCSTSSDIRKRASSSPPCSLLASRSITDYPVTSSLCIPNSQHPTHSELNRTPDITKPNSLLHRWENRGPKTQRDLLEVIQGHCSSPELKKAPHNPCTLINTPHLLPLPLNPIFLHPSAQPLQLHPRSWGGCRHPDTSAVSASRGWGLCK